MISDNAAREIRKVSEVARYLWDKGWAERNAGNITVNLTGMVQAPSDLSRLPYHSGAAYPRESAGMVFWAKRTQERIRDLIEPKRGGCVMRIDDQAAGYHVLWGGDPVVPDQVTSEFISHVLIHVDQEKRGTGHRAVVHTHPIELIALTHHPEYNSDDLKFTHALWRMLPEVRAFIPRGVAVAPYLLPGSKRLGEATMERLRTRDVVLWKKHGATSSGADVLEAFDFLDVANKGATVFLKCLAAGYMPEGLHDHEMQELVEVFNLAPG